jgi:hypothetical protein
MQMLYGVRADVEDNEAGAYCFNYMCTARAAAGFTKYDYSRAEQNNWMLYINKFLHQQSALYVVA